MPDFPSSSSASGIWQMRQVKRAVQGGNWPPLVAPDPYFEYVSLLLPGNGTNGAQNNTFLDSSTNNFTITRNGNTTQGTFTPYGLNWSNYFNNSTGLGLAYGTATHSFWNSDFTLEFWVNCPTKTFAAVISSWWDPSFANGSWQLAITTGVVGLSNRQSSMTNQGSFVTSGSTRVDDGLWHHVAVTQVTGANKTFRLFVDGVLRGYKVETNWTQGPANSTIYIGNQGPGTFDEANRYLIGYLSNLRLTTSVVSAYSTSSTTLGTTVFTPPTAPLSVTAGTNILTCADNRFVDDSTNNFAITRLGDVSVQRFSPFSPTTPYATGTIGGSGYFDGNGDYLSAPDNAAWYFTGDFTVECWAYWSSVSSSEANVLAQHRPASAANQAIEFWSNATTLYLAYSSSNVTTTIAANQWYHLAMSCSSGTASCYVNGTRIGTFVMPTRIDSADPFTVGARTGSGGTGGTGYFTGYVSDVRVVNGTGLYSGATITVPTAPLTAITNAQLLLSMTNGGIIDNAMMNDLETVGNAQISTSVSKFGGGSMYFDGAADWLQIPNSQNFNFGSGNFTVEGWVYCTNTSPRQDIFTTPANGPGFNGLTFSISGGNFDVTSCWATGSWQILFASAGAIVANTWYHFAIVRNGGTLTVYINGTSTYSNATLGTNSLVFGLDPATISYGRINQSDARYLYGYLDDFRITKGFARYTSNFSVPTTPFPTQ